MPDDVFICDAATAQRRVATQFPQWADLEVTPVASTGTDNWMFRLGPDLALRLPRHAEALPKIPKEAQILRRMAGLPLITPKVCALGQATAPDAPPFLVLRWITGTPATPDRLSDPAAAARDLARFLHGLRGLDTQGAPEAGPANNMRGVPLLEMDRATQTSIAALSDEIDDHAARMLWAEALAADPWQSPPVWLHGDLKADNLLAHEGKLVAVLDFGLAAVGDPAADLACAWSYLPSPARQSFFDAMPAREDDWARARGWALYGAVIALSYYRGGCNEALCAICRATLGALGVLRG